MEHFNIYSSMTTEQYGVTWLKASEQGSKLTLSADCSVKLIPHTVCGLAHLKRLC